MYEADKNKKSTKFMESISLRANIERSDYFRRFNFRMLVTEDKISNLYYVLQQSWRNNNRKPVTCEHMEGISFSIPTYSGWISKKTPRRVPITVDSNETARQPMKLQHIAAASSVHVLKKYKPYILLGVYRAVKDKNICIRAGEDGYRKNYDFSRIVKNYIYKQYCEPLVSSEYFKNIEKRPIPFCIMCGLFKQIYKTKWYLCDLCDFMRYVVSSSPAVEKPYHYARKNEYPWTNPCKPLSHSRLMCTSLEK